MWLSFNQYTMIIPYTRTRPTLEVKSETEGCFGNRRTSASCGTAVRRHNDDTKSLGRAAYQNQTVQKVAVHRRNFGKGAQMWQKLRIREIDAATAAAEESYLRFLHPNFPLNKGEVSRDYR